MAIFVFALAPYLRAQTIAADYQVQGTFNSSVGSIGPLTIVGPAGGVIFTSDTVNGNPQQVLNIQASNTMPPFDESGVQTQTNPFLSASNYSIVLLANFNLDTADVVATKIFDFKNLSSDAGLYVNAMTGTLAFIDGSGIVQGTGGAALSSLTYAQIVLTRDSSTNLTSVYLNGTLAFSFTDNVGLAVLGDSSASGNSFLTLFKDDGMGLGGSMLSESTQGNIARLRLYDGVLSADDVMHLDTTVPEPSTFLLCGIGGCFLVALLRRRQSAG
jgi:Concanavalin A-like lectin/glucanases superfamily/PEP-CTERM motif